MPVSTTVTYLFDPLCGWCYGASPAVQRLGQQSDIRLELAPTGLFSGGGRRMDAAFAEFAWSNDQRIAKLTGQPFTQAYRHNVLGHHGSPFDSAAMTLGITAVSLTEPERELETLKVLQEARYVKGLDTANELVVTELLRDLGLEAAAQRLTAADAVLMERHADRLQKAQGLMQSLGAQGVPALVVHDSSGPRLLRGNVLYGSFETLLGHMAGA
ncbi:MAG: protein-disulfide isomerase [Betaproteobacteria bacterium HGW-Betaproteobacteria-16]|nr:MAG: protein-disulfide isomerase [Betaproteobacteria bacterium HGW-Betaproteobacteria-16]